MDNIRIEVRELMRICECLMRSSRQGSGLTDDECDAMVYYAVELEKEAYRCALHRQAAA